VTDAPALAHVAVLIVGAGWVRIDAAAHLEHDERQNLTYA
jgi:hypothetical protein